MKITRKLIYKALHYKGLDPKQIKEKADVNIKAKSILAIENKKEQ